LTVNIGNLKFMAQRAERRAVKHAYCFRWQAFLLNKNDVLYVTK